MDLNFCIVLVTPDNVFCLLLGRAVSMVPVAWQAESTPLAS